MVIVLGQNERGARNAVMSSRLGDFAGYRLAVDCDSPGCDGERFYNVADLARLHGGAMLMRRVVARL